MSRRDDIQAANFYIDKAMSLLVANGVRRDDVDVRRLKKSHVSIEARLQHGEFEEKQNEGVGSTNDSH
jgi:uncharacterized membrane protein